MAEFLQAEAGQNNIVGLYNKSTSSSIFRIVRSGIYNPPFTAEQGLPKEYSNNVERFEDAKKSIYGAPSIYGDQPGFNFGFRQPYVYVSPYDSDLKKYIKRFDSRAFPIGSVIQDSERIGKLLLSGKGVFFLATQFLLQANNPFNETSLYNPLSIPLSVARPAGLGLLPRQQRHVNLSNFSIGSLFGFGNQNTKPPAGTLSSALSSRNKNDGAGLQRARTGVRAMGEFSTKWGDQNGAPKTSFLASLAEKFLPSNLAPLPRQSGRYKVGDTTVFDIMSKDSSGNLSYIFRNKNGIRILTVKDVIKYTPESLYYENDSEGQNIPNADSNLSKVEGTDFIKYSESNASKQFPPSGPNIDVPSDVALKNKLLSGVLTDPNTRFGKVNNSVQSPLKKYQEIPETGGSEIFENKNYNGSLQEKYDFPKLIFDGDKKRYSTDALNLKYTLDDKNDIKDLVKFYFYDVYNNKYLPFRNTIRGLSTTTTTDWEEIQYIGRSDKVYTYRGFSEDISFGFIVYANSKEEMSPMWKRANYLKGLCKPVDYSGAGFIIPPFLKFTIGSFFKDQPCLLRSFGINIADDVSWDLDHEMPMLFDCNVSLTVLQKSIPKLNIDPQDFTEQNYYDGEATED